MGTQGSTIFRVIKNMQTRVVNPARGWLLDSSTWKTDKGKWYMIAPFVQACTILSWMTMCLASFLFLLLLIKVCLQMNDSALWRAIGKQQIRDYVLVFNWHRVRASGLMKIDSMQFKVLRLFSGFMCFYVLLMDRKLAWLCCLSFRVRSWAHENLESPKHH